MNFGLSLPCTCCWVSNPAHELWLQPRRRYRKESADWWFGKNKDGVEGQSGGWFVGIWSTLWRQSFGLLTCLILFESVIAMIRWDDQLFWGCLMVAFRYESSTGNWPHLRHLSSKLCARRVNATYRKQIWMWEEQFTAWKWCNAVIRMLVSHKCWARRWYREFAFVNMQMFRFMITLWNAIGHSERTRKYKTYL